MIAPGAIIGDVDILLAARAGGDQRAVDVEHGLVEEVGRLLLPDLELDLIEDVPEGVEQWISMCASSVSVSPLSPS